MFLRHGGKFARSGKIGAQLSRRCFRSETEYTFESSRLGNKCCFKMATEMLFPILYPSFPRGGEKLPV